MTFAAASGALPLRRRIILFALLVGIGALWGGTMPVTKIAVATGYQPLGLIFWQLAIATLLLAPLLALRGTRLPRGRRAWGLCLFVALTGTLVPNSFSYRVAAELPAGVVSIVVSAVPLFALPIAVALGMDRPSPARLLGLLIGLAGVAAIALPEASLPDPGMAAWIPVALIAPLAYACEGVGVSRLNGGRLDPVSMLFGASLLGLAIVLPLALASGQFISPMGEWSAQKSAIVASAMLHATAYSSYLWLIGAGGATFAAQVSYLVTGFGVAWSILFLGESYSGYVWAALALMLGGIALVQPKTDRPET